MNVDRGFWSGFLLGTGAGAGLAALADPERGRRRRAMLRDQAVHGVVHAGRFGRIAAVDASHRLRGVAARARSLAKRKESVTDDVLLGRVRTRIGRVVSHPHAVHTTVRDGMVELDGDILAAEHPGLLAAMRFVPGVKGVQDRLRPHAHAGSVPSLQSGHVRPRRGSGLARVSWTPATRALAVAGAVGLISMAVRQRGAMGYALGAVGTLVGLRALTDLESRRLLGLRGRRGIDVRKNLHVAAPPEVVYRFWRNLEGFPRFMPHVYEVKDLGNGRSRWTISGPAGTPVHWIAEIVRDVPGEVLAWRSVEGSLIGHAGIVRFKPAGEGTDVEVQLTYNPPGGVIAHAVAAAFGADPKHDLDRDLLLMKSLIEDGKTTAHGETVRRDEIAPLHGTGEGELRKP